MTSVPMVLVIGMLAYEHSLRSDSVNNSCRTCVLIAILKRIGKKEVMKGVISQKDFEAITARFEKEDIKQALYLPVNYESKELRVGKLKTESAD
jgi:hypothetical protein